MESSTSALITNPNTTLITNTEKYVHTDEDDDTDEDRMREEDDETNDDYKGKVPTKKGTD